MGALVRIEGEHAKADVFLAVASIAFPVVVSAGKQVLLQSTEPLFFVVVFFRIIKRNSDM